MEVPTVIIDNGSGYIKAGLHSDETPSVIFPTVVGKPRMRFKDLYEGNPSFAGDEAVVNRHHLSLMKPIDHGHIDDWLEMEEIWNHTFNSLGVNGCDTGVLLTEPPNCSSRHRERMAEIMFEAFEVMELNSSVTGLMAIYGTGRTTGFVLDIGEGITQCVPISDGYLDKDAMKRSDFGGEELQMYLQKIICDLGYPMTTRDDYEHVRVIKESLCFCSIDPASDQNRADIAKSYTLPDGLILRDGQTNTIELGAERFFPAEALFNPQLCNRDNPPLTDLVWSSVLACPMEIRKSLIGSVILSGGSTMFPGFPKRLENEIKNSAPPQARHAVSVIDTPERAQTVWIGARAYCGVCNSTNNANLWTTKEEWDEIGSKIIHKKAAL